MRRRYILWIGLSLYAVSFFLIAIADSSPGIGLRGYQCANNTFFAPWDHDTTFDSRLDFLATLISGWINPAFLIAAALSVFGQRLRLVAALRIVVLLMIPFCWIVFHYESLYPREGHFVWIIGMLLVLFSRELSRGDDRIRAMNSGAEAPN
ncbi:MAG: hypothetical protein ACLP3K_17820 [Candidatus Acidiferrales bacterium]